jgi:hypothetical protein
MTVAASDLLDAVEPWDDAGSETVSLLCSSGGSG